MTAEWKGMGGEVGKGKYPFLGGVHYEKVSCISQSDLKQK